MDGINALIAQGGWKEPQFDVMETAKNALLMKRAKQEMETYPEEQNWLRKQRGMAETTFNQAQEDRMTELTKRPFKDHIEALTTLVEEGPMISYDKYESSKAWFERHGLKPDILPPKDFFERNAPKGTSPEEYFETWKSNKLMTGKRSLEQYKAETARITAEKEATSPEFKKSQDFEKELETKAKEYQKAYKEAMGDVEISLSDAKEVVRSAVEKRYYPEKQTNQPSAGNAVDLAIKRKFGTDYLKDPAKSEEADKWLATDEGRKAVIQARDDLTPPSVTYLQTSEGFVPAVTRGPGIGTTGKPTELRKPISDAQLAKVGELNAVLKNINKTKELYGYGTDKEHEEWVGPIAGRKGGLEAKYIGTASPDQVKFYAYVKDMQDALLRARSGAQINEQEYKRLVAFLPDPNLPAVTFKAKLERFEEATQIVMDEKLSAYEKGGFGVKDLIKPSTTDFRKKYNY